MLLAGDEIGRTQRGNNNAWCQDNELSWLDWDLDAEREELLAFTRRLLELRRRHPAFRRRRFLDGDGSGPLPDAWWFRADGRKMTRSDWESHEARAVGLFLNGDELGWLSPDGEPVRDDSFLVLVNASAEPMSFTLPPRRFGAAWALELDTASPQSAGVVTAARGRLVLEGRSLVLLRRER
jgi:glycogen operon protein